MAWYTCNVTSAGPASDGTETPVPVVYIQLTDQGGAFTDQWFYAAEQAKDQMLATALSAISTGFTVQCGADPPDPGGSPYTALSRMYLIAS